MALQFVTSQIKNSAITNDKLAGSIANAKLANSTISGVALGSNLASLSVDDSSIEYSSGSAFNGSAASTIRVKALGVTNAMLAGSIAYSKLSLTGAILNADLAGSIADSKLLTISTANKVALSALDIDGATDIGGALAATDLLIVDDGAGGTNRKSAVSRLGDFLCGDGLAVASGVLSVGVDDSSIEINSDALRIKASGVTNAMLNGSIANAKLSNSTVSYGGVSLALGASDATPAFDLSDATNYPTTSLVGTITNAQLAGSIANGKLANSSVTIAGQGVALGGSLAASTLAGALALDDIGVPDAAVAMNSQKITGLATPTADGDAATKAYVDGVAQGLDIKDSVKAATTANITLSGTQTIDGVSVLADDRVLVKDQSTASQNGIYVCAAGSWSRASDFATGEDEAGAFTFVEQGTTQADSGWVCTNNKGSGVVGTDALAFSQFSGAGSITAGDALTKTGNTLNVAVDGSSIEVNADALRVKALGITNAMLAGSIADSKLNQIATADKVAGSAVQLGSNGGLLNSTGLKVDVDDSSIALTGAGKVEVKAAGVTLGKLGITPAYQRVDISGGATTTIALSNRIVEAAFRNGGWIHVFRNGQRMDYLASGANENSEYSIADNGSATSVVAGAAFEDGDQIFITYMH